MDSGTWIVWYLLSAATGSPVASLLLLLAIGWLGDRFTFRVLPDPVRMVARWRRKGNLRRTLLGNPHDRRARFELAELLLEGGRPGEAAATLRPNVEAGDEDVHTAYVMGAALARSGAREPAERALAIARDAEPGFRMGEIDLEVGRMRLAGGELAGAREALERLLVARPGTVEGRFLLARALEGLGDEAGARRVRDEAWLEYASLPGFQRRRERRFAWRIRPWRPAGIALAIVVIVAALASWAVPSMADRAQARQVPAVTEPAPER
jgi:tetratricopeptide (TPR) repeat protein